MSDEFESGQFTVYHHGGNQFSAFDTKGETAYRVNMDTGDLTELVSEIGNPDRELENDERLAVLGDVIAAGPEYRKGPQEQLHVTVEAPAGGNAGTGGQSGGADGDENDDPTGPTDTITEDHDFDLPDLADDVESWLEDYSNVKKDLDPSMIDASPSQATIPGSWDHDLAGSTQVGLLVDHDGPWSWGSGWDNSSNEWTDDDEKEAFDASQEAFREIMKDTDGVVYFGDTYENFLPAGSVEDVI